LFNILFMKPLATGRFICVFLCLFYNTSSKTVAQSISGIINSYYKVTAVNSGTSTLTLTTAAGLTPGTRVLIMQMQGAVIDASNSASFGNVTGINDAGNYEFNYICSVAGNDVLLVNQLTRTYNPSGNVQLISVPQYDDVTVTDTVKAATWNAATGTGGVVALEADTIYLNRPVSASGQGFTGGILEVYTTCSWATNVTQFFLSAAAGNNISGGLKGQGIAAYIVNADHARGKQANGGGGGNNHNTGGGGGGNYGAGGAGGRRTNETTFLCHGASPGIGGLSVASLGYTPGTNKIFMGGGGGAGHQNNSVGTPGGNGGGIVIITANVIVSAGESVLSNGSVPANYAMADPYTGQGDGGGGGGAGGTIILNINEVSGSINAIATGAKGSDVGMMAPDCTGPGGGGGGGIVWMKGASSIPGVSSVLTGGINGTVHASVGIVACAGQAAGATQGGGGASITGYILPVSAPLICTPLPLPELRSFTAQVRQQQVVVQWTMHQVAGIAAYEVERSIDKVHFTSMAHIDNMGDYRMLITDREKISGTSFYRLKITRTNNTVAWSAVVKVTHQVADLLQWVNLFPNPATQNIRVTVLAKKNMTITVSAYSTNGQRLLEKPFKLSPGYSTVYLPLSTLSPGVYWLAMEYEGVRVMKPFVKK
jgi:hypothetical protein